MAHIFHSQYSNYCIYIRYGNVFSSGFQLYNSLPAAIQRLTHTSNKICQGDGFYVETASCFAENIKTNIKVFMMITRTQIEILVTAMNL